MSASLATPSARPSPVPASGPRLTRVDAFGLSDQGQQRTSNQDAYAVVPHLGLFIVADGMGGAAAGEVASRMAVETVRYVFEDPEQTWPRGLSLQPSVVDLSLVRASVEHANARVVAASVADRTMTGMGTTLSVLLVLENRVALAHVGDSRIYGLRGRRLQQLTDDHTLANAYVRAGALTREEAAASDLTHVLVQAVGTEGSIEVDAFLLATKPGDTFLLCSDGLHGVVDDETIAAILLRERDLTRAANQLVAHANARGGPDNITVVLVRSS